MNGKILYIDCGMGAAGDMLSAALYELLDDEGRKKYIEEMNSAGIEGVTVTAKPDTKAGIAGTHMSVMINGEEELPGDHHHHDHHHHDHDHDHHHHHHDHDHHHHHHHASMADVDSTIDKTAFSDKVKADAKAVYRLIADAESRAHGKEVSEIHFHEVGMKDAIADVLGVCRLMEMVSPDKILASPLRTGFGEVKCAHGVVPVPAPATAYLLEGIPSYAGDIRGEMLTPTGAALLKYYVNDYVNSPLMISEKVGYGCGTKEFERANCVRAIIGHAAEEKQKGHTADSEETRACGSAKPADGLMRGITELSANIDDMTGEELAYASDIMRYAGALEVFTTPVFMKKNRPGYVLTVLCRTEDEERIRDLFFKHTSTWGIRRRDVERYCMDTRIETRDTSLGPVRFKTGEGFGITKTKPEYEDLAAIASDKNMSIREIIDEILGTD
ncbi:MAG: nickel pincer cofactor biosynthesis protein LarC [Lachnospiraceae bacterium]|nr:nickel pincer cofactor biosynthesis protein LarC [Lachnospiraceae bacterium]